MKKITTLLLITLCFLMFVNTQANDIKNKLPKLLNANNSGKEFYFSFIPALETEGGDNYCKIYISSAVRTKVVVEVSEKGFKEEKYTLPNDVIEFSLPPAIAQAYRKTEHEKPKPDSVFNGVGVHVVADDPIICYGMTRYQYTSDGFLAIPVNALGEEYIVSSYADPSTNTNMWLPAYTTITAAHDNTKVTFTMGGNDWSATAGGLLPDDYKTWALNEGDVLVIAGLGSHADISGSQVSATKPVAVVSGNFCAYIPTNCGPCDVIEEMEIPTYLWGKQYHISKIIGRKKNSIIKVYAKESKTKIYRDISQIGYIRHAGGVEGNGHLYMRTDDGEPRPIVISGDKPIGVTQYNPGLKDDNVTSDPFQMVLNPVENYTHEITFHTPNTKGGTGFPNNYINLCYEATEYGTIPEDLEFAQVYNGEFSWQKMGDLSPSPGEPFVKDAEGKTFYSKTLLLPGDGVYKIKSSRLLMAYSYGFSGYDSYGFPSYLGFTDSLNLDFEPPNPIWTLEENGNVNIPNKLLVYDMPEDETIRSNVNSIELDPDYSFNYKLLVNKYIPCKSTAVEWGMAIIDREMDAHAVLTFSDCAGNDTTIIVNFDNPLDTTNKDFEKPETTWQMDVWGDVNTENVHYVVDKPDYPGIRSNLQHIYLGSQSYNYELTYAEFDPCVDYRTDWKLTRIDRKNDAYAEVFFTDCAYNTSMYSFEYKVKEDLEAPVPTWLWDSSGSVMAIGEVIDKPENIAVRSNIASIDLDNDQSHNVKLLINNFTPCEDEIVEWRLEVIDPDFDALGILTFTDCSGNDTTIKIGYLSDMDNEPPRPDWEMDQYGNVNIQKTRYVADMPIDKRRSNLGVISYNEDESYNYRLFVGNYIICLDRSTEWSLAIIDNQLDGLAEITFSDCAGNDTTISIFFDNPFTIPSSVGDDNVNLLNVYPNPADQNVIISGVGIGNSTVNISDILGNKISIEKVQLSEDKIMVNVKDLSEGMYLIKFRNGKKLITRNFVVVH